MSRTYRRKNDTHEYYWVLREHTHLEYIKDFDQYESFELCGGYFNPHKGIEWTYVVAMLKPNSIKGKKELQKYHSDVNRYHGGKGPGWFYNLYCQKPYRQEARKEIKKSLLDDEYEVILPSKPKAVYWD